LLFLCFSIVSAATLPAILRHLTNIQNASQYDVWSVLLHIRQFSTAKYVMDFIFDRYCLCFLEKDRSGDCSSQERRSTVTAELVSVL
jgi:hypothetical protein